MVGAGVPERTCVGCRAKAPKASLLRIARTPAGAAVDRSGRAAGRGAYVHRDPMCVRAAFAKGALWRVLRTDADADAAARLRQDLEEEVRV